MLSFHKLTEEDRLLLKRAEDCARAVTKYKTPQFTKFVSPHERVVFENFAEVSPFIKTMVWGGAPDCERSIIGFFPDFKEPGEALFPISAVRISAPEPLGHRDILGSVLGLGIERSLVGDIYPEPTGAVLFCLDSISDFICMNLSRVGRVGITAELVSSDALFIAPKETKEISGTVASLRLDAVLGLATGKARAKVQALIDAGLVQVNWTVEDSASRIVCEGDILSVRGFGRMKLKTVGGESKKGRIWIVVEQYI
ncbi:MAG: RNA-binding protein [Clostridia bacterium]|nr:RNA-binding protein [Clostridia bacterium]